MSHDRHRRKFIRDLENQLEVLFLLKDDRINYSEECHQLIVDYYISFQLKHKKVNGNYYRASGKYKSLLNS